MSDNKPDEKPEEKPAVNKAKIYKQVYDVKYNELKNHFEALDFNTVFENMPPRSRMEDLMNWSVAIPSIYASLGAIYADAQALMNRLRRTMLDLKDFPEDKDIRRSILGSSTMFNSYADGKFHEISTLMDQCKNHRESIKSTLDLLRTIISEYNRDQQVSRNTSQFEK